MADSSKDKIIKNLIRIKEVICYDLDPFVDELIQKDIFNINIKDKLDGFQVPIEKSDILVRMIICKGSKACDEFVQLLQKNNCEFVLSTTEEAESKGSGSREHSFMVKREISFIVSSQMEDEGACAGVQVVENSPKEMSTRCSEVKEKNTEETPETKYKHLQKSYIGAKEQLKNKRQEIIKLKHEKNEVEKNLEKEKNENKDLKQRVTELKSKKGALEMLLEETKKEMSETKEKMSKIEEMLKEDREWRNRLGKEFNDHREALDKISDFILNIELVRDKDPPNIDDSERKQQFKTGAKTKSKNPTTALYTNQKAMKKKK